MEWKKSYFTFLKYAFSIFLTISVFLTTKDLKILVSGLLEIALIFICTNEFYNEDDKIRKISLNIISSILCFIFNLQMLVMYFGGTYISMMMLTNVSSLRDISSNFGIYGLGLIALIFFSFLPIYKVNINDKLKKALLVIIPSLNIVFVSCFGGAYNTVYSLFSLLGQSKNLQQMQEVVNTNGIDIDQSSDEYNEFYKDCVQDYISKPESLPDHPNVIVIFTEGLSKSIIDDERELTPNLRNFSENALSFTNYYNHTFATYRGLIGQLYSGHQLNNSDSNNLVSIQSIFSAYGYNTAFINTEPDNKEFSSYLQSFGFDRVITDESKATSTEKTLSDKSAYELLFDTCVEMNKDNKPFFTAIYTFGTHVSLDSPDEEYDDGTDAELNKFYNMDYQFGEFLEKFNESDLAENTLLVFTTDHCTYADQAFWSSFPESNRVHSDVGEIVLYYYYTGIKSDVIDVKGRNSINMAPTLLDYLDMSAPNFFLGESLFAKYDEENIFTAMFYDTFNAFATKNGKISNLEDKQKNEFVKKVTRYLTLSRKIKVETIPMPSDDTSELMDEGNYFEDETIDSYYSSYDPNSYNSNTYNNNNYYYYYETEEAPVEPSAPEETLPPAPDPVIDDGGSSEVPIDDTGGGSSGESSGGSGEPVVNPAPEVSQPVESSVTAP